MTPHLSVTLIQRASANAKVTEAIIAGMQSQHNTNVANKVETRVDQSRILFVVNLQFIVLLIGREVILGGMQSQHNTNVANNIGPRVDCSRILFIVCFAVYCQCKGHRRNLC